jgi:transcriptional regulator with XRE-family HTH domain
MDCMLDRRRELIVFRRQIGMRLREQRLALDLSQEELAWEADIAQASISNYENGRNDIPLSVLIAICQALGVRPVDIVPDLQEYPVAGEARGAA